jgi:biotin carboxyl carrier protein
LSPFLGTLLIVMESMKMETTIVSLEDGVVDQIFTKEGVVVQEGEPLLFLKRQQSTKKE